MGRLPPFSTGAGFRSHPQYWNILIFYHRIYCGWLRNPAPVDKYRHMNIPLQWDISTSTWNLHVQVGGWAIPRKIPQNLAPKGVPMIFPRIPPFPKHVQKPLRNHTK